MAIVVNTNISSMIAQGYVNQTSNNISKNIQKLSSGLRINSASDDASGLAISEKLKGQISGLKQAASNAQDGISMLQTAEGGLSTIQEMTQRMRELAVQSSNGTYTSSDRQEIQKEVDQIKDEINRVASSTEFNTKKLLNGDSTALWSSDSSKIGVTVNSKVAEGNYNLNVTVDPGKNYVYKTDVMTLNSGSVGAEITTASGTKNSTNIVSVSDPSTIAATGTSYYTVKVTGTTAAYSATLSGTYRQSTSSFTVSKLDTTGGSVSSSGYLEVKFDKNITTATTAANYKMSYRFIDAKTGTASAWTSSGATATAPTSSGVATITLTNFTAGGADFKFNVNMANGGIQSGDQALFALTASQATKNIATSGGGTVKISAGPDGVAGPTISYTTVNSLTKADNGDSVVDTNGVSVYYATLNSSTGNLDLGSVTLNFKENSNTKATPDGLTTTGSFSLDINGAGGIATSTTKLKDISLFTTSDGTNLFDQTQSLTVYGNGKSSTIYLEGDDTVSDFQTKLQSAITSGLGMGADSSTSTTASQVNNNLVNYVSQATSNTNQAVQGTFVIQTAKLGTDSQLSFVGNESLVNALSLATIQDGQNSAMTVKVTDAHTGASVGSDTVNDNTLKNVIQGVNVSIDSSTGLSISWNDTKKQMDFTSSGAEDIKLHLVDNSTQLQIGANEGQSINTSIAQADTTALGLANVTMVDQDSASKAITTIDAALSKISDARATIGAQVNRLEYAISGLNTTNENLTASESRISDVDMASEMSDYTKNQILSQAGVAMISQANKQSQLALSLLA